MGRNRNLLTSATHKGKEYIFSSTSERNAFDALTGPPETTHYPDITVKLPIWITPGSTVNDKDLIILTPYAYTFVEGEYGFDEFNTGETPYYQDNVFSRVHMSWGDAGTNGLSATDVRFLGMYNGPTVVGPDHPEWTGGDSEVVVLDIIISGSANYVADNLFHTRYGYPLGLSVTTSSSNPGRNKLEAAGGQYYLMGWYTEEADADAGTYIVQIHPGYQQAYPMVDGDTLTDQIEVTNGITVPANFASSSIG